MREGSFASHGLTRGDSQGTRLLQVDTEYRPPADYRPRPAFQADKIAAARCRSATRCQQTRPGIH